MKPFGGSSFDGQGPTRTVIFNGPCGKDDKQAKRAKKAASRQLTRGTVVSACLVALVLAVCVLIPHCGAMLPTPEFPSILV